MRKEVLFAILAGVSLGLILAFGVWRANLALRSRDSTQNDSNSETQLNESSAGITLATPEDFEVVSESPYLISGITKPNFLVAISASEEDYLVKSDSEGEFKQEISLTEGVNEIFITSFDTDNSIIEKRLLITYSTEFAKQVTFLPSSPTDSENETSTASNEIREKVQEKVEQAKRSPKFVMGSVTDKLTSTIEIKNLEGEIKQISLIPENTVFIKIAKTRSEVKFSDLAIGDFIVVMGFQNGNGVVDGRRILITEVFKPSGRIVLLGSVFSLKRSEFTFKSITTQAEFLLKNNKDLTIYSQVGEEIDKINFTNLEEGQQVAVFGTKDGTSFTARTIVVVEQPPSL